MAKAKTFNVQKFKEYVNEQLARTDKEATEAFKQGLCAALEHVLHKTNNYNGLGNLYWIEKGCDEWRTIGKETEVWAEKKLFIYGTPDSKYHGNASARKYY